MIELVEHPQGTILPVRARPGASRNEIRGEQNGMLKVSVTQIAEKGKANRALIAVISKGLGLKKSQLELVAGNTSSEKRFLVRGIDPKALAQLIERVQ